MHITNEWKAVLLKIYPDMGQKDVDDKVNDANTIFPLANIHGYDSLIESHELVCDPSDRHVVAAAIKGKCDVIVTNNIDDFKVDDLMKYHQMIVIKPDDFICDLIDLNINMAIKAFRLMVDSKENPPLDDLEVLDRMRRCDLKQSADFLHSQL